MPAEKPTSIFASPEKRNQIVCLLLAALTLVLYNPVTHHPFVNYDDDRYVTENPHVRPGLTGDTIAWALTSTEQANWHPLTWMSHALDVSLFRLNPAGHHFTSVLIHAANVVLLYLLLIWATGRFGSSLFAAALFAIHPINVESVAWVAERKNVLCTFFFLLTLWAYGWYRRKPRWTSYLVTLLLFAAALAAKPMVITLPFILLLLDYWPFQRLRPDVGPTKWSMLILEKIPFFALSAASAWITMRAQQAGGAVRTTAEYSFGVRVENAIVAYAMYLWKMIWPARLAPLYPHPGNSLATWQVLVAALVLAVISALVWRFRLTRILVIGWLWFLGTLVPVLGLVQVGNAAMADRYAYIPLIGIFVAVSFGIAGWADETKAQRWLPGIAAVVLIVLATYTYRQIGYWQSSLELWSHTLAVTKNNFIAEDNLGGALIIEGKEEEAHTHFEAAARINPRDPMSRGNLGTYLFTHGHPREAVAEYDVAVTLTSDPGLLAQMYINKSVAEKALNDFPAARKSLQSAIQAAPGTPIAFTAAGLMQKLP